MFEKSILFAIALFFSLSGITGVKALEFKKEADKAEWIKNFFNDKEFKPIYYAENATKQEKKFKRDLFQDFITQNGIEHVEPIAVGKSINDPEIAKFNVACPDKKSIDVYKMWPTDPEATDDDLDDPGSFDYIIKYRCTGNLKIYRANIFNRQYGEEGHVLYCNELKTEFLNGKKWWDQKSDNKYEVLDAYLIFDPEKCAYSKQIYSENISEKDYVTGIFKYKGVYYLYCIRTSSDKAFYGKTSIHIEKRSEDSVSGFYYFTLLQNCRK